MNCRYSMLHILVWPLETKILFTSKGKDATSEHQITRLEANAKTALQPTSTQASQHKHAATGQRLIVLLRSRVYLLSPCTVTQTRMKHFHLCLCNGCCNSQIKMSFLKSHLAAFAQIACHAPFACESKWLGCEPAVADGCTSRYTSQQMGFCCE